MAQTPEITADEPRRSVQQEISKEMVRLYKEYFGRGPTKVRTDWANADTLVVTLEQTLTLAEEKMAAMGEHQRLRDTRMFFQHATVPEFCAPVERLTGRKVRSFLSSIDTQVSGLSTEVFVLHPEGYEGPARGEVAEG